jgi:O-antigen ligase
MELNRRAFEVAWRLSILALPWQTRFFWDAQIVGWPWEQGRISIYLSWIPILMAVILGFFQVKKDLPLKIRQNLFWLVAFLAVCSVLAMPSPNAAAIQWWLQVMTLATFFITLIRTETPVHKVIFWMVVSLLPHALLAIWQFSTQSVFGSSWFGMASQNPSELGVSVVQTSVGRFLRAYGGFPHPNILGGWMAMGLLLSLFLAPKQKYLTWLLESLFTLALFYSFSRSAWLAAAVGLTLFVLLSLRAKFDGAWRSTKKQIVMTVMIAIVLFAAMTIINRDLVLTRVDQTSRLEQKSVITRVQSLKDGLDVFKSKWLFGTGPNTELPVLVRLKNIQTSPAPLEPPHMVWLMILANFGIAGTIAIFGFGIYLLRLLLKNWKFLDAQSKIFIITLSSFYFLVSSLDHYPWSLWSGQILTMFLLYCLAGAPSEQVNLDAQPGNL